MLNEMDKELSLTKIGYNNSLALALVKLVKASLYSEDETVKESACSSNEHYKSSLSMNAAEVLLRNSKSELSKITLCISDKESRNIVNNTCLALDAIERLNEDLFTSDRREDINQLCSDYSFFKNDIDDVIKFLETTVNQLCEENISCSFR
ncbi:hypothetical protein [Ruminococcus sp.]|uniref:hypothetical protein n=1 Tax=Ruminococcus sp. TaxID=41978 RepID=UPI00262168D9|nr:hypothetical protein [Ruminococcus sp.]MDD6988212.1 hypothetical protein [Ruminococcus sp.]MDY6201574.1 hypothetical protein [Ruminococcus sp.]